MRKDLRPIVFVQVKNHKEDEWITFDKPKQGVFHAWGEGFFKGKVITLAIIEEVDGGAIYLSNPDSVNFLDGKDSPKGDNSTVSLQEYMRRSAEAENTKDGKLNL